MTEKRYLIHLQFLGFRYHGWQKQSGVKTVEGMVEKTLDFITSTDQEPAAHYRLCGASRTDALVSAGHYALLLISRNRLDPERFTDLLNQNLPPDIRVIRTEPKPPGFDIRNAPRSKEYLYLFSWGRKMHPFAAPLVACFPGDLDIGRMQAGAALFAGTHEFIQYCTKPGPRTQTRRRVQVSELMPNSVYTASFFPKNTWVYRIRARGFMRNQVRLIMGQLVRLGRHEIALSDIERSLADREAGQVPAPLEQIAPASGLVLNRVLFDQ